MKKLYFLSAFFLSFNYPIFTMKEICDYSQQTGFSLHCDGQIIKFLTPPGGYFFPRGEDYKGKGLANLLEKHPNCKELLPGFSILKTLRKNLDILESVKTIDDILDKKTKECFTQLYKIHLMPTDKNIKETICKLLHLLKTNKIFKENIGAIKFKISKPDLNSNLPLIVIYTYGKKAAETILSILLDEFKDIAGTDIIPRFNKKISSLIFYSQGNSDDKLDIQNISIPLDFLDFFDENGIHFKADFVEKGSFVNHELELPDIEFLKIELDEEVR